MIQLKNNDLSQLMMICIAYFKKKKRKRKKKKASGSIIQKVDGLTFKR